MLVQFEEDIVGKTVLIDQKPYIVFFIHIDNGLGMPMVFLRPQRGGKTIRENLLSLEFPPELP